MRAIVVGGGIGGLCAAISLRRFGIDVTVFERAADPAKTQVGGGMHLWANATRVLCALGLALQVDAIGSPIESTEFLSRRGKTLAVWPVGEIARALGTVDQGVSRADLQRILYETVGAQTVRAGAKLTGFSQDAEAVTATFADGSEERADFLVGADGLRSLVRASLLGARDPDYAGYMQWQTVGDEGADLLEPGLERITFGPGQRSVVHHVRGGKLFWAAIVYVPEGTEGRQPGRRQMLLERFRGWPGPIEKAIERTPEDQITGLAVYDRRPVRRWGVGRVTLLGDAAHPMTTNTSQGANQAIEDALVLGQCVASASDVSAALRRYEAKREARTRPLVQRSRQAADMNSWRDPVRSRLCEILLGLALPGPGLRDLRRTAAVEL